MSASNLTVIISLVAAVIAVAVAVALVFIYRGDVAKAAKRKDEQAEQWGMELAKVSGVLKTTQELLEQQQQSNKIILDTNEKLTAQVTDIQAELRRVRGQLESMSKQLAAMTARAEAAEDKVDRVD